MLPHRDVRSRAGSLASLIAAMLCWCSTPCEATAGPDWWNDLVLVELRPGADVVAAQQAAEQHGGHIALVLPGVLVGWIPPGAELGLATAAGIAGVHTDDGRLDAAPPDELGVRFFKRARRGEFAPQEMAHAGTAESVLQHMRFATDAFEPGPMSPAAVQRNMAANLPQALKSAAASAADTRPAPMLGRAAVTLFFIESDGSGSDPDKYDWSRAGEDDAIDAALAALTWWSAQAHLNDVAVSFQVQVHRATADARCAQWREPVLHPSTDVRDAIADVLARFGYTSGDHLERAAAHNGVQRALLHTDAAFCSFLIANPSGADAYPDGRTAWAYNGGPYTTLLQRNDGWAFDRVFAHESGHIFGACDEYWDESVGGCGSCTDCGSTGVDNGNCEACNSAPEACLMRRNSWALCEYTPGQIGWWYDTPVHYVGPAGTPRLPFRTPATAARSIDAALDVAGPGDTLRLASAPIARIQPVRIATSVVIEGGWDATFASRSPNPTPIDARGSGPVIVVERPQIAVVLERLHLRNGAGMPFALPELGSVSSGGGLFCSGASMVMRDCILESNVAGTSSMPGVGGGAFFWNAEALLERCTVRNNAAGRGGGIALVSSRATLSLCNIDENRVDPAMPGVGAGARGAGIDAITSEIVVQDSNVRVNQGAAIGAGIHAERSRIQLTDVRLSDNHAADAGGGLAADATDVSLRRCGVDANSAVAGGGLHVSGGSLDVEATWIAGNRATGIGGAAVTKDNAPRFTNVTVARNEAAGAGGLMLLDEQPGAMVRNSIIAYNTHGGLVHSTPGLRQEWNDLWSNDDGEAAGVSGSDPRFVSLPALDLELGTHSPCIDTGDPALTDVDGSRSDAGAFGGAWAQRDAPARLRGVSAALEPGGVSLRWDAAPDDADSLLVYRGDAPEFRPSESTFVAVIAAARTEYLDAGAPGASWYKLAPRNPTGAVGGYSDPVRAELPTDVEIRRVRHELLPVAPNPANPGAWIAFQLEANAHVRVTIHDARGRRTRLLEQSPLPPGAHRLYWDGRDDHGHPAASGVYWVHLDTGAATRIRRFVVVR